MHWEFETLNVICQTKVSIILSYVNCLFLVWEFLFFSWWHKQLQLLQSFFLQFVPRSDFRSSCWSFYHPWLINRGHFLVWGAAEFMHGYVHLIWSFIWCSYISPVTSEHLPENCKPPVILRSTAPQRHILSIQVWLLLAMQGFLSKQLGCQACKELADIKPHAWICSSDVAHYMRCMPLYG